MTPSSDTDSVTVSFMVVAVPRFRLMGRDPREGPDSSVAVGAAGTSSLTLVRHVGAAVVGVGVTVGVRSHDVRSAAGDD
jgi:hypothetical protein